MKFLQIAAIAVATTEAIRLRQKVKEDPEHEMVQEIIDELDSDGSGTIELTELLKWGKNYLQEVCDEYEVSATECAGYWDEAKPYLEELFSEVDADGSGSVDRSELDAALKQWEEEDDESSWAFPLSYKLFVYYRKKNWSLEIRFIVCFFCRFI